MSRFTGIEPRWAMLAVGCLAQLAVSGLDLGIAGASGRLQGELPDSSAASLSMALFALAFSPVLVLLPWGMAADRFGERRIEIISFSGWLAVSLIMLLCCTTNRMTMPVVLTGLFLTGVFSSGVTGPSGRDVLAMFPLRYRTPLISARVAMVPLGGALGTLLIPLALRWHGLAGLFMGCAAMSALLLAFNMMLPNSAATEQRPKPAAPAEAKDAAGSGTRHAFKRPMTLEVLFKADVWRIGVSGGMFDIAQLFLITAGTAALAGRWGLSVAGALSLVAAAQLAGSVARFPIGMITLRISSYRIVQGLCILQLIVTALLVITPTKAGWLAGTLCVMAIALSCMWQSPHFGSMAEAVPVHESGTALGFNNMTTALGAAIGQTIAPLLLAWSILGSIALAALVPVAFGVIIFSFRRRSNQPRILTS